MEARSENKPSAVQPPMTACAPAEVGRHPATAENAVGLPVDWGVIESRAMAFLSSGKGLGKDQKILKVTNTHELVKALKGYTYNGHADARLIPLKDRIREAIMLTPNAFFSEPFTPMVKTQIGNVIYLGLDWEGFKKHFESLGEVVWPETLED